MDDAKAIIDDIRKLCREKLGNGKGVIIRSWEGMEVGIKTFNFEVLGNDGLYYGYWTDQKPEYSESTVISQIIDSEDCQEWETLDDDQLVECRDFLRQNPQG